MIVFTDDVINDITRHIAAKQPEQGGAGMGPADSNLISRFVPDPHACVSAVSYRPSKQLTDDVRRIEEDGELVLKSVMHSHPGIYDTPSGPDHTAFSEILERNPHMSCVIAPIVTQQAAVAENDSHVSLGNGARMTCYRAWRRIATATASGARRGVNVERVAATVSPMQAATACLIGELKREAEAEDIADVAVVTGSLLVSGSTHITKAFKWTTAGNETEITLLFPATFPFTKPAALISQHHGASRRTEELFFDWSIVGAGVGELSARLLPRLTQALKHKEI